MKASLYTALLILFTLSSCTQSPEVFFEKEGVSLTCPAGWAITDQESIEGNGYYLSMEKDGFNSSGLFTINWVNGLFELDDWIMGYRQTLKEQPVYSAVGIDFGELSDATFNGIKCKSINFTTSIIGLKHSGTLYAFHGNERTFCALRQEADEDRKRNKKGFETIESSFAIQTAQPTLD